MRVYRPADRDVARSALLVQPGREFPTAEWMDVDGKPRLLRVEFRAGAADVPDNLARYLIDHDLAARSPLVLPAGAGLRDSHA